MASGIDINAGLIAVGVLAVIGLFIWHILRELRVFVQTVRRFADGRAERQRAGIDAAARAPESIVRRTGQVLSLTALVAIVAYAALRKFSLL